MHKSTGCLYSFVICFALLILKTNAGKSDTVYYISTINSIFGQLIKKVGYQNIFLHWTFVV